MKKHIFLIAVGFCGLAASSQAQLDPSLVAWYKFDEEAGAVTAANAVSGSSTGTIFGGVTTGVSGKSGNAYEFTKTSQGYVDMGNASFFDSINTSQRFTIAAWINTDSTQASGTRNVIAFAGSDTSSQTYADMGYSGAGGTIGQAYARNRPNLSGGEPNVYSGTAVGDDNWHQVVMTLEVAEGAGVLSIYIDGDLANTQSLTGAGDVLPTLNNFEIGRLGRSSPTDYYGGLIDDVQVYDAALSPDQVNFLFNNPGQALPVPEPGTCVLAGLGLGALCVASRRKKRG